MRQHGDVRHDGVAFQSRSTPPTLLQLTTYRRLEKGHGSSSISTLQLSQPSHLKKPPQYSTAIYQNSKMSGLMDKIGQKADQTLNNKAQPGDGVERTADNDVNSGVNDVANDVGVPQQDDSMIDKAADAKTNSDIPFGNN
ncbi:hypothetical protein PV11_06199 [Exophiala sideris]|uniref:Uncharacterized protein n=1 Tax=Exophiala sideris TaxID=1016849 RepID=A0A0D1YCL1_9EURO|nr:hypothetical protein PV11_06199 [Exophiala sideris]